MASIEAILRNRDVLAALRRVSNRGQSIVLTTPAAANEVEKEHDTIL
jgi:hypothetical protein